MDFQKTIQEVIQFCNKGDFKKAKALLDKIISDGCNDSEAWRIKAQISLTNDKKPEQAIDELIQSLNADPQNVWALILMGNIFARYKKDMDTALNYYNKVLEYHPDNAIALTNIGAALSQENRYDDAISIFEKSLAADSTFINSYYGLCHCYMNQKNYDMAFDVAVRGLKNGQNRIEDGNQVRKELEKMCLAAAQQIVQNTNYIKIWKEAIEELKSLDGRDIVIDEDTTLKTYAKAEYAPIRGREAHIVKYNPKMQFVDHLIFHELMHLKMAINNEKEGCGKIILQTKDNLQNFIHKYGRIFAKLNYKLPQDKVREAITNISQGLGLQVANIILDLFVEDLIYENYPQVKPLQLLSLYRQERDNISSCTNPSIEKLFPKEVISNNRIMNMVTSMHFKDCYGFDLIKDFKPTKQEYNKALDIYQEYEAFVETFNTGDEYELTNYLIEALNLEDFITIIDQEEFIKYNNLEATKEDYKKAAASADSIETLNAKFAEEHPDGANGAETMMMAMYMLGAMQRLDKLGVDTTRMVAMELAMLGQNGISPQGKYNVKQLEAKQMGGYEVLAYYYVSVARSFPQILPSLGLPFKSAYEAALQMYNNKK